MTLRYLSIAVGLLLLGGCAARYDGPPSDHFDGRHFRNSHPQERSQFFGLLRWRLFDPGVEWPEALAGATQTRPEARVDGQRIKVTYVNHATVLVQAGGLNILTDPVWSERVSPVTFAGPMRHNPPGVPFDALPKIDVVIVSHNHYDHMDTATLAALWRRAYVLETAAGRIYFAGDTGYGVGDHFKKVAARFGNVRLAIVPIGGYEPRWFMEYPHVNPEEAVQAALDTCAEAAMGHHWGTFRLTNGSIMEPPERAAAEAQRRGLPAGWFHTPLPGQSFELSGSDPSLAPGCPAHG